MFFDGVVIWPSHSLALELGGPEALVFPRDRSAFRTRGLGRFRNRSYDEPAPEMLVLRY